MIMKRDDPSATPMSDRLADRIDDFKRIYPPTFRRGSLRDGLEWFVTE